MGQPDFSTFPLGKKGRSFEDFTVGECFEHHWGRTFTSGDNSLFTTATCGWNPIFVNAEYARAHGHSDVVVNPMLVLCTAVGLSVEDLSEAGGPFLGMEDCVFHRAVHPGDTLIARSRVVDTRSSDSRPRAGIVTWHTQAFNQGGELILEFRRTNLVSRRRKAAHGMTTTGLTADVGYFEDFEVGQRMRHFRGATIDEVENNCLSKLVMNTAQAHWNEDFMTGSPLGEGRLVFGLVTASVVVGLASQDTSENAVAELGLDAVRFSKPVHHGDTVYAYSEVLSVDDGGLADAGTVRFKHWGLNQHGEVVCEMERRVLLKRRGQGNGHAA